MSRTWYCSDRGNEETDAQRVPVQVESNLTRRGERPTLPRALVKYAADEYNRQGYSQSMERLCERGGLGVVEIILLMADAIEHLKLEITLLRQEIDEARYKDTTEVDGLTAIGRLAVLIHDQTEDAIARDAATEIQNIVRGCERG